jgi:hypothetical protein
MKTFLIWCNLALSVVLFGCLTKGPTAPVQPTDIHLCGEACDKLQLLNCEEAKDIVLLDGTKISCTKWCTDLETNMSVWLNPSCILTDVVKTCSDIEKCAPTQ